MRIGVITLFGAYNYGNRLQNIAVTKLLEDYGHDVYTIVCERFRLRAFIKMIYNKLFFWSSISRRNRAFENFNRKYIKVKHIYRQDRKIPKGIDLCYDAFVVGSDQVWNPEIRRKEKYNFYLKFASSHKRLCISPSIGCAIIEKKYEDEINKGLHGIKYLSCREDQGALEIQRITQRECVTTIDPTLGLNSDYWRKVAVYKDLPDVKYILCIFLGTMNKQTNDEIVYYAKANNFIIINLLDKNSKYYAYGPEYFISLIDKAEMVFTDSFHAVAFSINLNTSFYAFDRNQIAKLSNLSSRITTLLNKCGLQRRFVDNASFSHENVVPIYNFDKANSVLNEERTILHNFISKSLGAVSN